MSEKKSYGVQREPLFRIVKERTNAKPVIDISLNKKTFRQGVLEEAVLEIESGIPVDEMSIEFIGVEANNVKIKGFKGKTSIPVRLRFINEGAQQLVLKVNYEFQGRSWSKEVRIDIDVKGYPGEEVFIAGDRRYILIRLIGSGGSADVYEALDDRGNVIALKVYKSSEKSFIEEVGKLKTIMDIFMKKLRKPLYVVNIIDAGLGSLRGVYRPYIAMDYYPMNLETLIHRGDIELKDLIKIVTKVARILMYASSIGIHHGDLKPQNILVRYERGRFYPAVGDWGGSYTPCYAAPEVYEHGAEKISEKSDVWSFGVILYEAITRSRLFKDKLDYEKIINEDIRVNLPHNPRLEKLINKCLCRNPDMRPSFREVFNELEAILREELGTLISGKEIDIAIEKIISLSEKETTSIEDLKNILAGKGLITVDPRKLLNYAIIISKATKARLAVYGGNIENTMFLLEQASSRILSIADEELKNELEKINCLDTMQNLGKTVKQILKYPVSMNYIRNEIEKLEMCLYETIDIVSQLILNLIVKQ